MKPISPKHDWLSKGGVRSSVCLSQYFHIDQYAKCKKLITGSLQIWNQESIKQSCWRNKEFQVEWSAFRSSYVHPFCLKKLNWKLLKGERNFYILWEKITVIAICEMLLCFWVTWLGVNLIHEHMSLYFLARQLCRFLPNSISIN